MEEIWKDIKGYERLYRISNTGKVIRCSKVRALSNAVLPEKQLLFSKRNGYYAVILNRDLSPRTFSVHRLVATHFIPNPFNKPQVNHIDGNKFNNIWTNLEWATSSENINHAWDNNLCNSRQGIKHHMRKLSETDVIEIFKLAHENVPYNEISKKYNIGKSTISRIKKGVNWNHLTLTQRH